jgi:hypothetical protein
VGHPLQIKQLLFPLKLFSFPGLFLLLEDREEVVLNLIAQGLLVGIFGFLDGRQELADFVEGDSDALPFHATEPVIFWLGRRAGIGSLVVRIICIACYAGRDAAPFARPLRSSGLL